MNILGISACSHDSGVCLVKDGEIVVDAKGERGGNKGNDVTFCAESIADCLQQTGIDVGALDYIAFDSKPFVTFERILKTYLTFAPTGFRLFLKEMPLWIQQKLRTRRDVFRETGFQGKIIFPEHHEVLAASAFFPSPFQEAAFLVVDGVGEWATTSYGIGAKNGAAVLAEMRFPHSLGLLYAAFIRFLGFKVHSGTDKMMEIASNGEPIFKSLILSTLMDLKEDGSFRLDTAYFDYCSGLAVTNAKFAELFGRPPRTADSPLTEMDMDIACSIQAATEEVILMMVEHVYLRTGRKKLCLAGEVSRYCTAGDRILRESSFDEIWVQPAVGGAGAALGAALFVWHQYLGNAKLGT